MQNKKGPYESIYFVTTKQKNLSRGSLDEGAFFLNAAVVSRKIVAKYWIGTRYWHLLNIIRIGDWDLALVLFSKQISVQETRFSKDVQRERHKSTEICTEVYRPYLLSTCSL